MNRLVVKSRIGADGVLQLNVPVGAAEANRDVQVTIEPAPRASMTQEEWRVWVNEMAGSVTDPTFRRHDQGELEQREALP
ncbi:MAG: hypothetical protein ACT4QC_17185 [Planctomycetaceae bacterium]